MRKCVRYHRVSTEGQVDKYGLDAQDDITAVYADRNELDVVETFIEPAVSGKTDLEDRVEFGRLLNFLDENPDVLVVLIPDLSRLARDLIIQETLIGDFQKRGIEVVSVMEPDLCSDDPTRKLMRQMIGAFNEYERVKIVLKLKGGRIQKAKSGQHAQGRHALGYSSKIVNGRKVTVKVDDEVEIVRLVRRLREERKLSYQRIADYLNDKTDYKPKHWTPERPTKFFGSTIRAIYNNKRYEGLITLKDGGKTVASAINDELKII